MITIIFISVFLYFHRCCYGLSTIKTNQDHLVILSHGILGQQTDLTYLSNLLKKSGCLVLDSKINELYNSLHGLSTCSNNLKSEITHILHDKPYIKRISFVGNSLGGLITRYVISLIYNETTHLISNLIPYKFLTIATPHLGVLEYTFLDEFGWKVSSKFKKLISNIMLRSGKELFLSEEELETQSIVYKLATEDIYLKPLKAFHQRRLYANLMNDFMVPLGTAAFIQQSEVIQLRKQYRNQPGFIPYDDTRSKDSSSNTCNDINAVMMESLNTCQWEKLIVNFPGFLPIAHNKIAALTKSPDYIYETLLATHEGQFVMQNASDWLLT